jgi:hypothetical protein
MAQKINYSDVPYNYALCISSTCPQASSCLRALAWKALPGTEQTAYILNPVCVAEGEECTHYRDSKPVRYAVGFTKMQKMMFPQQYERFSNQLKGKFGRNPYFERRNGQHPMPPEEQQLIRQTLEQVGVSASLEFDAYKDAVLWESSTMRTPVLPHKDSSPLP